MTSKYIPVIEQMLELKYPEKQQQQSLSLENIKFKLFLPKTTLLLTQYKQLKTLAITHCDLRNLQHFPKLHCLQQLDLSFNQIQGTFNYLIPLKKLRYLNIEDNLVFELNKLAPLRKIAAVARYGQQTSNNTGAKLSICIRNNPFTNEETSYINKLKSFGLRVIKQPKQYFEKKKIDEQKNSKSGKKNQSSGKKSSKSMHRKEKKSKKKQHQEIDSFYSGESERSSLSSGSDGDNSHKNNGAMPNSNNHHHHDHLINNRPSHRPSHRFSNIDNHGILLDASSRIPSRMSSNSRQTRLQFRNIISNPFVDPDDLQDNDLNQMNIPRIFGLEDDDSDSDEPGNDRFGTGSNRRSVNIEQRMRQIEQRAARLQQLRQIQQQHQIERQRRRLQRLRQQQVRHRQARQVQLMRRFQHERQRQRRQIMTLHQRSSNMSDSSNRSRGSLEDQWRLNPFRRRGSNGSGLMSGGNRDQLQSNSIGAIITNSSNSNLIRAGRPMSYRHYMERVNNLERNRPGIHDNSNNNDNNNRALEQLYAPLRVRQSGQNFPNIIRLSRDDSIGSQQNSVFSREAVVRESDPHPSIMFRVNSDDISDQMDEDDLREQAENELNNENDQDEDDMDMEQLDSDEDDEDEQIHECDSDCQHNQQNDQDQEEQEQEEQLQQDDQNQQNEDIEQNNLIIPLQRLESENISDERHEFLDYLMSAQPIRPLQEDSMDLIINEEQQVQELLRRAGHDQRNASLSSQINPDSDGDLHRNDVSSSSASHS